MQKSPIPKHTQRIIHEAEQNGFIRQEYATTTFKLTAYQRLQAAFTPVIHGRQARTNPEIHVYIEGDGNSWKTRYQLSNNPTPRQPLALQLAMRDPHPNVIYLARPCQYTPLEEDACCEPKYWSSHRYAPEVITAVNDVLDMVGCLHQNIPATFVLIGFSGGASVAMLVAGQRKDVKRLITVAGDLNHAVLNQHHRTSPLTGSLNPSDNIELVRDIPQHHWCGTKDNVVPCWTTEAFCQKINRPEWVTFTPIKGATHHDKWVKLWPSLIEQSCK